MQPTTEKEGGRERGPKQVPLLPSRITASDPSSGLRLAANKLGLTAYDRGRLSRWALAQRNYVDRYLMKGIVGMFVLLVMGFLASGILRWEQQYGWWLLSAWAATIIAMIALFGARVRRIEFSPRNIDEELEAIPDLPQHMVQIITDLSAEWSRPREAKRFSLWFTIEYLQRPHGKAKTAWVLWIGARRVTDFAVAIDPMPNEKG